MGNQPYHELKYKMNPISKFKTWYAEELKKSRVRIPSACCLSTYGLDGYPNSRFLSLKEVLGNTFVITGPLNSRKGIEIQHNPKVSLTFWWTESERQVRIQGSAEIIDNRLSNSYFNDRNRESKIVSTISEQGKAISNPGELTELLKLKAKEFTDTEIKRPENWGGFSIKPIRIEFLEFDESRLHIRELFTLTKDGWKSKYLQP